MDDPFVERMRRALTPEFEVERVLPTGGMGVVVLAREVALDRPVAIKTIRPELATAAAVERFLHEARTLARVPHKNIVPIHALLERDGLLCIVMQFVPEETLAQRLERGPLPLAEVRRLGRDILAALEFAHARGIIHRDIKPSNIFIATDRAMLADFGISKDVGQGGAITTTGRRLMTLMYASPEQIAGLDVGAASDLYSLAAVLYEALTSRVWSDSGPIDNPAACDWRGVPADLAATLRRALAFTPGARWRTAAEFARALRARRPLFPWQWAVAAALAVAIAGSSGWWWDWFRPPPPAPVIPDVALGPFRPSEAGERLREVAFELLRTADRLTLAPLLDSDSVPAAQRATHHVTGVVVQASGALRVELQVDGHQVVISGEPGEVEWDLGRRIALAILEAVKPDAFLAPACKPRSVESYNAFMRGQEAFRRDDWVVAMASFEEAVARDHEYCLAAVRLWLVQRWSRQPTTVDLRHLLAQHGGNLAKEDSLMLAAELAPTRARRWALYTAATRRNLFGAVAPLQYGGDLMHRGPLDGIPLDSGVTVLREARERDPQLASVHDQLVWALTRLGYRDSARAALRSLTANARASRDVDPSVFELIWAMRFLPGDSVLPRLLAAGEGARAQMSQRVRLALSFDLAPYESLIGAQLVAAPDAGDGMRAHGHIASGLGLLALGRPLAGLAQLDSAAAMTTPHRDAWALQAAQWKVLATPLGVPAGPDSQVVAARARLEALTSDSILGGQAAWTLALDASWRGDAASARAFVARIPSRDSALRAIAMAVGMSGDPQQALALTAPWRGVREEGAHIGEPFSRAILHLRRAEWYDATGDHERAERERRWHENSDFVGWLAGPVQAAEVDWVVGAYVRVRESMRRVAAGDLRACADLRRVVDTLWQDVEPAVDSLRRAGQTSAGACP